MLNKRISSKVRTIVIGIVVGASLIFSSIFMYQRHTINDLKKEVQIQTETTEQRLNYTETKIDTKTIEIKFNELQKVEVLNGKINIKHTYNYNRDSILGFDSNYKLTGTADFYYSYVVNLASAEIINATSKDITLSIDKPYLDEAACHRINNSFYRMNNECDANLLSNKNDAETCMRHWEDTFDKKGVENIKDYYIKDDNKTKELNDGTKRMITDLLKTLGYDQKIKIVFND